MGGEDLVGDGLERGVVAIALLYQLTTNCADGSPRMHASFVNSAPPASRHVRRSFRFHVCSLTFFLFAYTFSSQRLGGPLCVVSLGVFAACCVGDCLRWGRSALSPPHSSTDAQRSRTHERRRLLLLPLFPLCRIWLVKPTAICTVGCAALVPFSRIVFAHFSLIIGWPLVVLLSSGGGGGDMRSGEKSGGDADRHFEGVGRGRGGT